MRNTYEHPEDFKGGRDAYYVKSKDAADAVDTRVGAQRGPRSMGRDLDRQTGSAPRLQPDEAYGLEHKTRQNRADIKGGHDAHNVKSKEATYAPDAALSHSLEGGWNLVQGKKGEYRINQTLICVCLCSA